MSVVAKPHRRKPCPTGCQTIIRSPIQGLMHMIGYCIDCHSTYVEVPLKEWDEYVLVVADKPAAPGNVLPFRAS